MQCPWFFTHLDYSTADSNELFAAIGANIHEYYFCRVGLPSVCAWWFNNSSCALDNGTCGLALSIIFIDPAPNYNGLWLYVWLIMSDKILWRVNVDVYKGWDWFENIRLAPPPPTHRKLSTPLYRLSLLRTYALLPPASHEGLVPNRPCGFQ